MGCTGRSRLTLTVGGGSKTSAAETAGGSEIVACVGSEAGILWSTVSAIVRRVYHAATRMSAFFRMAYLDLDYKVRTDGEFRDKIFKFGQELDVLQRKSKQSAKFLEQFNQRLRDFVVFCNFNLVFLTGFYFPRYPKDKPLLFSDYAFSMQLLAIHFGSYTCIKGSRQISKSTTFGVRQLLLARVFPGWRSLYLCPRRQQLETYQNRLLDLERAQIDYNPKPALRSNLRLKEFSNGSRIELAYILNTDANIRSRSCDEIILDEAMDFDADLETNVKMVQSASVTPVTTYAGTSLTTDTFLEKKFNESSMASWVMTCPNGHENIPLLEHGVLDMIQKIGPCCTKCGKLLDVRRGRFLHADMKAFNEERYGYHIPQLIVPAVVNNPMRWAEIWDLKNRIGNERKFKQEVLGIATEEGEREITRKQLQDICILGDNLNLLQERAAKRQYQYVVSGCDWGGSDYQPMSNMKVSTTVHVIMGITATGMFDILRIDRYTGMNYDSIIQYISANHLKYAGTAMGCDTGVGAVYNSKLRETIPPEKHLMFTYVGPTTALISEPKAVHIYNTWSLNKTESLSFTFDAIRAKRIRCFDWRLAGEYLEDCLNMYRAPGEKSGAAGTNTFLYRASASKPNDTLQAMNYAYMLGKILLGEPMFADNSVRLRVEQTIRGNFNYGQRPGAFSG